MKRLSALVFFACIQSTSAFADDLGETKESWVTRFGAPVATDFPKRELRFQKGPWDVHVVFDVNGSGFGPSRYVLYRGREGATLTESDLFAVFEANGGTARFKRTRSGTLRERWIRDDNKLVIAVAIDQGRILGISVRDPTDFTQTMGAPTPSRTSTRT